jgi:hypothetical protein
VSQNLILHKNAEQPVSKGISKRVTIQMIKDTDTIEQPNNKQPKHAGDEDYRVVRYIVLRTHIKVHRYHSIIFSIVFSSSQQ